jgi:talin
MNFDEMILEAAKSIMAASSALVRAANAAQRELIDQGKVANRPLTSSADGQWSEGLISAARLVAAATHSLVEAAQNLVLGKGTEEMLISSAKQVASSTAQLLIACKVKSDPTSEAGRRLQSAGNAVIKSTDNLVRAAQQAIECEEEHTLKLNRNMVDGMAQEINARSEVLKMERQLEEARNKLVAIRLAKYRHKVAAGYVTDESDFEGGNTSATSGHDGRFASPSPTNLNRSGNFSQTTNSFNNHQQQHNQTSSTTTFEKRSNLLTANAIPKPYNSSILSSGTPSPQPPMSPMSPINNRSYETAVITNPNLKSTFDKSKFESCVQDLNEKVYGKGSPSGGSTFSTFKTTTTSTPTSADGKQNYEGYTTR